MPQVMEVERAQPAFIADTAERVLHSGLRQLEDAAFVRWGTPR
jgi:hypothetical protein